MSSAPSQRLSEPLILKSNTRLSLQTFKPTPSYIKFHYFWNSWLRPALYYNQLNYLQTLNSSASFLSLRIHYCGGTLTISNQKIRLYYLNSNYAPTRHYLQPFNFTTTALMDLATLYFHFVFQFLKSLQMLLLNLYILLRDITLGGGYFIGTKSSLRRVIGSNATFYL